MGKYNNILSKNRYLIDKELSSVLENSRSIIRPDCKSMVKQQQGVYLVIVRALNNENNVLIYNYLYYPLVLSYPLMVFLSGKNDYQNSLLYSEWGDFLTVISSSLHNDEVTDRLSYNTNNERLSVFLGSGKRDIIISNYSDLYLLINRLISISSLDEIVSMITLAHNRNYVDFSKLIFDNKLYTKLLNHNIEFRLDTNSTEKIDILNSTVFVVSDLELLVEKVRARGFVFNTGPQKWRGQVNSMNNFLTSLDIDYRNSLYKHNQYHVAMNNISSSYALSKSKFSYRNIHQNLGGVRWYSTKRNKDLTKNLNKKKQVSKKSINENSPAFGYLSQLLDNSPINNKTQEQIEEYLLDSTYINIDNTNKKSNPLIDYNLISSKELGLLLLNNTEKINKIINNFKKIEFSINKKSNQKNISRHYLSMLLKEVDNNFVLTVIYGRLMRIISRHNMHYNNEGVVDIFHDMANNIIREYYYRLYNKRLFEIAKEHEIEITELWKSQYKFTFSDWKNANEDLVNKLDDPTLKGNIGGILTEWMIECNLIEIKVVLVSRTEKKNILVPTSEVLNTLDNKVKSQIHLPFRIPMIIKPKPFYRETINGVVKERLGGYLLNDVKTSDSLIIYKWDLKEQSQIKNNNKVYDLVNNINSVGYKINTDVLNFIYKYGVEYDLIEYKANPYENKVKLTKREFILSESYNSKIELQENILGLANVMSKLHEFFIPVRLDNRGRMYCISEYLNYQSNELAKSLLLFSKGEKLLKTDIKGINYFKAYGANCYGNKLDKKSWNDRIKWIDDNEFNIINFNNGKLIKQATNKMLFIAFCFEYNRWLESLKNVDSTYFETFLPVQLDATCNGYQHLALLSLDLSLAKELNLITSSWDDVPKDFYNFLSSNLIDLFRDKLNRSSMSKSEIEDYTRLVNLKIQRTLVKKGIMTIPYNVSTNQMIKYIMENFERFIDDNKEEWYCFKDDNSVRLKYSDFSKVALGLREVLNNNFFKLKLLMKYLKDVARICTKLDIVIPWGTPSGVLVNQSYLVTKEVRLKPFTYSKSTFSIRVLDKKGAFNASKQVRAFMPNLIHSLDAASLALLADMYFKDNSTEYKNFYAIHDCFAVTANNVENIMEFLKLVYIRIYSNGKYLKELDNEIKHQIKYQYGDISLDETKLIIKTEYVTIKYPDIDEVLGNKLPSKLNTNVLKSSSYLIN